MSLGPICQWLMFYHRIPRYRHYEEAYSPFLCGHLERRIGKHWFGSDLVGQTVAWLIPRYFETSEVLQALPLLKAAGFEQQSAANGEEPCECGAGSLGERDGRAWAFSHICIYIYVCVSIIIYLSIYLSVYLSSYLYICLSVYLSIYLAVQPSVWLSVYLSVCIYANMYILPNIRLVCRCMLHGSR